MVAVFDIVRPDICYYYLPISTDPAISKKVAKQQAWNTVSTFDPTLVPNELATSLAPIPKAKTNAIKKPKTISHIKLVEYGSSILMARKQNGFREIIRSVLYCQVWVHFVEFLKRYTLNQDNKTLRNDDAVST